ncbi:MAG: SLC13 family permease [Thermomicrobiales bacterium]
MSDLTITLLILVIAVVFFIWNRLPVGIVALGVALSLWATGVLTLEQSLAGFGSPTVVLIGSLLVVAEALDAAGITTWAGQQLAQRAGDNRGRLIVFTMAVGALLSALITPNGAAAALIPMVVILAVRQRMRPSLLLLPLAYAAHAGSLLMLTGTPVNVLVSEAAADAGFGELRFFEFARVGLPLLAGTILIVVLLGAKLLPDRAAKTLPRDLSQLPQMLLQQYIGEEAVSRLRILPDSPLIGAMRNGIDLQPFAGVRIVGTHNERGALIGSRGLAAGDVLVVSGPRASVEALAAQHALAGMTDDDAPEGTPALIGKNYGVAEVIVTPRSRYAGEQVFPGMITESGELVILAVQRQGEDLGPHAVTLRGGDTLLLRGTWDALDLHTRDPEVVIVDAPDAVRRQAVPIGTRTIPALVVLGAMVLVLTTGVIPAAAAALIAAIAMVLLGVISVEQAQRSLAWTTLILVAGMIPLSTAITQTGAADLLASTIVSLAGGGGPYLLLLGLFVITAVMGQLISNTATALILIPIAISVAAESGISALPLLMCVNVASAAALMTPVATPANMMVMGPGGYTFGDYVKFGLPVMLLYLLVAVFLVPVWWPL